MKTHTLNTSWCKGCGICVAFCPKQALSLDELRGKAVWDSTKCVYCGLCEYYCPDLAIRVVRSVPQQQQERTRPSGTLEPGTGEAAHV